MHTITRTKNITAFNRLVGLHQIVTRFGKVSLDRVGKTTITAGAGDKTWGEKYVSRHCVYSPRIDGKLPGNDRECRAARRIFGDCRFNTSFCQAGPIVGCRDKGNVHREPINGWQAAYMSNNAGL